MKYWIVVNEWKYPAESGYEVVDSFSDRNDAIKAAKIEVDNERKTFLVVKGNIYEDVKICDKSLNGCGYLLCSSPHENENMIFQSILIERQL